MADPQRARKLADRIKEVVARRIDRGLKDPRLGFVTITDVRVTGDLQHASIFYTVYGTDQERADTAAALKSATGMLRSEVGRNITARLTPSLEFIPDALPENAANIDDLLARAQQQDAETQRLAASAEYAGEADPYVKPRSAEDDDWDEDDLDDEDDEDDLDADDDLDEDGEEDDDVDDDLEGGDERDDEVYATDDLDPDAEFDDVNDAVVASDDDLDPDADDND